MSSVIWIWTLNSIIVSAKKQIMLHWLHLQRHSKNTRNSSSTTSSTLLDTRTWRKPKQDACNRRRNFSVRTRLYCLRTSQRTNSIWSNTRYKASPGAKSITNCIPYSSTTKMLMETSNTIPSVSFQMTTHLTPVLLTRFRHYWWNSWSKDSRTSQRSITILMVVVDNIKISRISLIYVPIKRTFPSKQNGFSLQLAMGNHRMMGLVVRWNAMLQNENEVCRYHSATEFWTIVWCWKYARKKWNQLFHSSVGITNWTQTVQWGWLVCGYPWLQNSNSSWYWPYCTIVLHLFCVQFVVKGRFGERSWWVAR